MVAWTGPVALGIEPVDERVEGVGLWAGPIAVVVRLGTLLRGLPALQVGSVVVCVRLGNSEEPESVAL